MQKFEIDATNQSLGRLASKIAIILRGKNLPAYNPSQLPETEVIIKDLKSAKFTGRKFTDKKYYRYTGYHGGIRTNALSELWEKNPEKVLREIVYRMLPVNRQRDKIIKNLKFK